MITSTQYSADNLNTELEFKRLAFNDQCPHFTQMIIKKEKCFYKVSETDCSYLLEYLKHQCLWKLEIYKENQLA